MSQIEQLKADHVEQCLNHIVQTAAAGTLSFTTNGKWHVFEMALTKVSSDDLQVDIKTDDRQAAILKKDQPVGICLHCAHCKYVFESVITEPPCPEKPGRVHLDLPDQIEMVQQRVYERHAVPSRLNVRAMFWHRGYLNNNLALPKEECWQGKLENISVGGAMIRVDPALRDCFCIGQIVGLQFTPMPYQKPILLEAGIRHLQASSDGCGLQVGVEFLGLEAGYEGRQLLHRLLDVINAYEKMNK